MYNPTHLHIVKKWVYTRFVRLPNGEVLQYTQTTNEEMSGFLFLYYLNQWNNCNQTDTRIPIYHYSSVEVL